MAFAWYQTLTEPLPNHEPLIVSVPIAVISLPQPQAYRFTFEPIITDLVRDGTLALTT